MTRRLRARLAHALDRRFGAIDDRVAELQTAVQESRTELADVRYEIAELHRAVADIGPAINRVHADVFETSGALARLHARVDDQVVELLRSLVVDDAGNRRLLEALRADPAYERPFVDPDPLVSICVATRADRAALLLERALPSALAQTYEHLEVVIVGDGFDPLTDPDLAALDDPRIRFGDVTHRIENSDPGRRWLAGATLPRQESHRLARGLWITDLDDDDALRPDAVQGLLDHARSTRAEVTNGLIARHDPDGSEPELIAGFPPSLIPGWSGLRDDWSGRGCTAALWHRGLQFFVRQHVAAVLDVPGDLFLAIRMARVGVRFGLLEQPVYDYYPGLLWDPVRAAPPPA